MSWVYQIQEVKTEKKTGETYVSVRFWPSRVAFAKAEAPALEEDFIMQLRPTGQRAVRDKDGKTLRQSGVWASRRAPPDDNDPPVTEEYEVDVKAQIRDNIERFLEQHRHVRGNLKDSRIKADESDPHGVLAKPEVVALRGKDFDDTRVSRDHA